MKVCSKCGIEKDEGEFHKDKTKKEGLSTHCKKCRKEKDKKYKEKNKEHCKEYDGEYREKNIKIINGENYNINTVPDELKPIIKQLIDIKNAKIELREKRKKIEKGEI